MTAVETLQTTSASSWPVDEGELHTLPSGGVALLKGSP
jgi:hypothetical protein